MVAQARDSLIALTRALIDIPSESKSEAQLLAFVTKQMPERFPVAWSGDAVTVFCASRTDKPLLLLAGHTDTVPAAGNVPSSQFEDTVFGCGASDMKGALAVMIELARAIEASEATLDYDIAFLFFGREELPSSESALLPALEECQLLQEASFCVLLEPTGNALELGCQGNLNITATFTGTRAHTARPWMGLNAAHRAIAGLRSIAAGEPNDVEIDGLLFREVASVTAMRGGGARNVIPDFIEADINIRYAPSRHPKDVEARWRKELEAAGATVSIVGNSAGAPVVKDPIVDTLFRYGARGRTAKQAWTNAADFAVYDIPTVNFGPGDPTLAHTKDEHVTGAALEESLRIFSRFLNLEEN